MRELSGTKFHFVGVGGIGMCGLAELMHNLGAKVSGSDMKANTQTERLGKMGIQIQIGHSAENIGDIDVLVYSSAVKTNNVELVAAREKHIPIIPRAEALAEIMRLRRGIAVAGTHGKTTTTSLVASAFLKANADPTIVVGGRLDLIKSTAKLGTGEWLIAEADESDGSFHKLSPEFVIITNIDNDHMDHYKTFENLQQSFYDFAQRVPFYGAVVACGDDPKVRDLFRDFSKKIIYYGFDKKNTYVLEGEKSQYKVYHQEQLMTEMHLPMAGAHNALNSLAAYIIGLEAGLKSADIVSGLENFRGVDRRFQLKGECKGAAVYDDYGHHPTEIRAVLAAFREQYPDKKLIVAFQPHRYTRFQTCWHDFLQCFDEVDRLCVLPVYAAGETEIPSVNSKEFCQQFLGDNARYYDNQSLLEKEILQQLGKGDVFITLGAGDIWKLGEALCKAP